MTLAVWWEYLNGGTLSNSYAAGSVSGSSKVGGLVGTSSGSAQVASSYFDTQATGQSSSAGGTGETTVQMMQQATYVGWDFTNTWGIYAGTSYPYLQWSPATPPLTTVYVDPAFTPDATHFTTIQGGINAVSPAGTVYVDAGNYSSESDALQVNATVVFGSTLSGAVTVGGFTMSAGGDGHGLQPDNHGRLLAVRRDVYFLAHGRAFSPWAAASA